MEEPQKGLAINGDSIFFRKTVLHLVIYNHYLSLDMVILILIFLKNGEKNNFETIIFVWFIYFSNIKIH